MIKTHYSTEINIAISTINVQAREFRYIHLLTPFFAAGMDHFNNTAISITRSLSRLCHALKKKCYTLSVNFVSLHGLRETYATIYKRIKNLYEINESVVPDVRRTINLSMKYFAGSPVAIQ